MTPAMREPCDFRLPALALQRRTALAVNRTKNREATWRPQGCATRMRCLAAVEMSGRPDPYFETVASLRRMFEGTQALRDYLAAPADNRPPDLKRMMLTELFGNPLPKPANIASGWRLYHIADLALFEIMESHGLIPPKPVKAQKLWRRIRTALGG